MSEKNTNHLTIDNLKMPTKINIGDTAYMEFQNNQNPEEENNLYFSRSFKCKNKWIGSAFLNKLNIKTDTEKEDADYLTLMYAPTKKHFNLYKENSIYECQKIKNTELSTTSKKFSVKLNDTNINFSLNNAGLFGDILEIYGSTNKLEGLVINLYIGNNNNFESIKNILSEQKIQVDYNEEDCL